MKISKKQGQKIASLINTRDVARAMMKDYLIARECNQETFITYEIWREAYDETIKQLREMGIPVVA